MSKKWLLIDMGDGWQVILPDSDTRPHSKLVMNFPDGSKKAFVDDIECPCHPQIDWDNKIISHNAFDGRE